MHTATLGGLIKDHRIKKRLSQLAIALRMGWKDTTRLSKIEQGRIRIASRDTLNSLMKALELDESEKGMMLLSSGILPTKKEAAQMVQRLKDVMSSFGFPLILVDAAWNTFYFNRLCRELFKISDKDYHYLERSGPNWLEMQFIRKSFDNIKIYAGYTKDKLVPFDRYLIGHFKYEHLLDANEKWFKNLMVKLSSADRFRKLWSEIPPSKDHHLFYNYEINMFIGNWRKKEETLKFHIFFIYPTSDFRFFLAVHQPADEHTLRFYK